MEIPPIYHERIRACYPDLNISSVYADADGLINNVYIVNNELVFRFPKNDEAREALALEGRVLTLVHKYVDMPTPAFEQQAPDFVAYRMIHGGPLYRHDLLRLDDAAQDELAEQLATFLQQLHSIPSNEFEHYAIPLLTTEDALIHLKQFYEDVERELFPYLMRMAKDWIRQLFAPVLSGTLSLGYVPTLTHNDLAPYHILYEKAGQRITGILDFGTASISDPAKDFAAMLLAYGEGFLRRIAHFYPAIDEVLDRARFYAGLLELEWALIGVRTRDVTWSVCHIGWARDVMPVGYAFPTGCATS
jgi:aminoglycoside 2''-phosphotransferase